MKQKTLSEKEIERDNKEYDNAFFWSKDVKEALEKEKKLIENFMAGLIPMEVFWIERNKIFGDLK